MLYVNIVVLYSCVWLYYSYSCVVFCDWQGRTAVADCQINNQSINQSIMRRFLILMYSCNTKCFTSWCKRRLLRPFMTLQQNVSKVSLIIWDIFVATLLESLIYSESNGYIFSVVCLQNHKLWPYN